MPYTPPAQRSPAASTTPTPTLSRRSSYQPGPPLRSADAHRPELPRSASYLTRQQRRAAVPESAPRPSATTEHDPPALHLLTHNGSVRQSPPPRTDESQLPAGAVLSPPDSAQNSSDDEDSRALKMTNLVQLQEAIRVLAEREADAALEGPVKEVERAVATALETTDPASRRASVAEITAALPREVRRQISHHRARTETYLDRTVTPVFAQTPSDEESLSDEDTRALMRPPMLRKKSGELVRPALRPSSARRRPSSMPGTPTFGKAVHFDSHLEHVRHFLQVDRPLAVSAGSSPVEAYEGETEFPFHDEPRGPPFEWELVLANFPADTLERRAQPVHVERVYLSADNKTLVGAVTVANYAFHKLVVARFTLDYWKTTSEVVAEYAHDVRQAPRADGRDRFQFHIKLADLANLEAKTMFFCVKYVVNGWEHWDNNHNTNYQVDFRRKALPQNGKRGVQPAAARPAAGLPRSLKKNPAPAGRPRARAADPLDDFAAGFDLKDPPPPLNHLLGESGPTLRLKGVRSAVHLPVSQAPHPTGQAFGTRYDFGASMAAAINASHAVLGDKSGITMKMPVAPVRATPTQVIDADETTSPLTIRMTTNFAPHTAPRMFTPAPGLGPASGGPAGPEKPGLASQSYHELLDKYCFVRDPAGMPRSSVWMLTSGL